MLGSSGACQNLTLSIHKYEEKEEKIVRDSLRLVRYFTSINVIVDIIEEQDFIVRYLLARDKNKTVGNNFSLKLAARAS